MKHEKNIQNQLILEPNTKKDIVPIKGQLLKWIGNKQRFATEIISFFPSNFNNYYEPFLGSGAVLGTLAPSKGIGSDILKPLIEIWNILKSDPNGLIDLYSERYKNINKLGKKENYEKIKQSYNLNPNPGDFLFLSRSCYGGVIRFRKSDGFMSTPCGVHNAISPNTFANRALNWHKRIKKSSFYCADFRDIMSQAKRGDLIYCDPPYSHSQGIVYGAQDFNLQDLLIEIENCKSRGVKIVLSIDGTKKSGNYLCDLPIPKGLFEEEVYIKVGRSMLRRFQMDGQTLEDENVKDRLLLTY